MAFNLLYPNIVITPQASINGIVSPDAKKLFGKVLQIYPDGMPSVAVGDNVFFDSTYSDLIQSNGYIIDGGSNETGNVYVVAESQIRFKEIAV